MTSPGHRTETKLLLGRRLTLVVAGAATFLAIAYIFAGVWFAKIQLEREFTQNAEMVTASLASSLIDAMLTQNLHEVPEILEKARMTNRAIVYAFVCDSDGNPVAFTQGFPQGLPGDLQHLAQNHAQLSATHRTYTLRTGPGDVFHIVYHLEGRPGGFLHAGFSLAGLDEKLRVTARHLIASMLFGLLVSTLVSAVIYRRMSRPILELTAAASDFGSGDLSRRIARHDEVEDEATLLAQAFNQMADTLQDKVTELTRSRGALEDEKARIQAILDGMLHGVIFYDPDGRIAYCNDPAREHWGWESAADPDSQANIHRGEPEAARAFECVAFGAVPNRHLQIKRGNRTLDLIISALRGEGKSFLGVVEISADVTTQIASARALAHAEKLNVVGQLAAGVAHEINSPLDGAIEAARLIERGGLSPEEIREFARAQRTALERIAAIVYRLLTYSRKEQSRAEAMPIGQVIAEAVELINYRQARKNLSLVLPDPALTRQVIEGEVIELSQVFVNIIGNAIDASPHGGAIKIEVSDGDGWVEVAITDQGLGIPAEAAEKLFTPFFTTKDVGQGTGLGLAISKNIVEQWGGWIRFDNRERPWGARFTVRLPWRERPERPADTVNKTNGVGL